MTTLIDIVFQNGDFYNEASTSLLEKLLTFIISLCGLGIPLLLFYLGLKTDRKKENERKAVRQYDNLKYFAILIDNIKALAPKQAENCFEVAEKIVQDPTKFPVLERIVGTDIKRIVNLLNHEDIFHAYLAKYGNSADNIQNYRVIFSYLDYLDKVYDQHLEDYDNYKDKFISKYNDYKKISDDLMDHVAILINRIKHEDEHFNENSFWNYINQLLLEYYRKINDEGAEKNIEYDFKSFINPIKVELVRNYSGNINSDYIVIQAKKATYIHSDIITLSVEMHKDFNEFQNNFNTINSKIVEKTIELSNINAT